MNHYDWYDVNSVLQTKEVFLEAEDAEKSQDAVYGFPHFITRIVRKYYRQTA